MMLARRVLELGSLLLFTLFVTENIWGGAGEMVFVAGIGIRRFLFLATLVLFALLALVRLLTGQRKPGQLNWAAGGLACAMVLVWVVLIPRGQGQGLALAFRDAGPLVGAGLLVAAFDDAVLLEFWEKIRYYLLALLIAYALFHIFLYVNGVMEPEGRWTKSDLLRNFWDPAWPVFGDKFVLIGAKPWGPRVNFANSFLLLIALYLCRRHVAANPWAWVLTAIVIGALAATQTRSLLIAGAVLLGVLWITGRRKAGGGWGRGQLWLAIGAPLLLVFLLWPTIDLNTSILRVFSRGETDNIRADQIHALWQQIRAAPLLGSGFGAHASYIRDPLAPFAYELAVIAIVMKLGLAGLLAWVATMSFYLRPAGAPLWRRSMGLSGPYALYCGIVAANFYNPSLFSFFGTFFIVFLCLENKYLILRNHGDQC